MSAKKLSNRISDEEAKVVELEMQLVRAKAYLAGMVDAQKYMPEQEDEGTTVLRDGSDLAKVRDILREVGAPLHVDDLLKRLGKDFSRNSKASLVGSLSGYVKRGALFTRPGPNTFGLVDMDADPFSPEPPAGFGDQQQETPPVSNIDEEVPF